MTADRIDTRDAYGDECVLLAGEPLASHLGTTMMPGVVACLSTPDTNHPTFTEDGAVEVASFLGRSISPAACRDLLAELAPLACSDDLPEAVKAFLVGEAEAPHLKRITAEGLTRGTVVRSLIELGRALGRAEERVKAPPGYERGTCDACDTRTLVAPTGAAGAVSVCLPCLETAAQEAVAAERAKLAGLVGAARRVVEAGDDPIERTIATEHMAAELAKLEGGA